MTQNRIITIIVSVVILFVGGSWLAWSTIIKNQTPEIQVIELKPETGADGSRHQADDPELTGYQSFRVPGWTQVVEPKWGIAFDVPKSADNYGQVFTFLSDSKNPHQLTFGIKDNSLHKVDGWRIFAYDIKQYNDLDKMITDLYGSDCQISGRNVITYDEKTKKSIYNLRVKSKSGVNDLGDGGCLLNFSYQWLYDEMAEKAVLVELGQAPDFFYCPEGGIEICVQKSNLQYLDSLIARSLHFVKLSK